VFGWFRKKSDPPVVEAQIKAVYDVCVGAFTKAWLDLNPRTTTIEELAVEINKFGAMATEVMLTKFPIMKQAPGKLIWLIICTARRIIAAQNIRGYLWGYTFNLQTLND
jgi:hypothetical protein